MLLNHNWWNCNDTTSHTNGDSHSLYALTTKEPDTSVDHQSNFNKPYKTLNWFTDHLHQQPREDEQHLLPPYQTHPQQWSKMETITLTRGAALHPFHKAKKILWTERLFFEEHNYMFLMKTRSQGNHIILDSLTMFI